MSDKIKILVVEDDADIRDCLIDALSDSGYEVRGATDGRNALEELSGGGEPPDLILLDLMMPVMDGASFRKEQLARPDLAKIPVILISAHQSAAASKDVEAVAHLRKPFTFAELLETVCRHSHR